MDRGVEKVPPRHVLANAVMDLWGVEIAATHVFAWLGRFVHVRGPTYVIPDSFQRLTLDVTDAPKHNFAVGGPGHKAAILERQYPAEARRLAQQCAEPLSKARIPSHERTAPVMSDWPGHEVPFLSQWRDASEGAFLERPACDEEARGLRGSLSAAATIEAKVRVRWP